ncbi:MAG: helix-turn-helix domain-containing protein [Acidimicrobiales bacterium]
MSGVKRPSGTDEKARRSYDSSRRQARARATRRSILDAAARLFVDAGYGATTLQQIADEAGVAVQTIYATLGSKKAILEEVLDVSIAGDDAPVAVNDRDWMHDVFHHPDPHERLRAYAAAVTAIHQRAGSVFTVIRSAAAADPELAPLAATTEHRRRVGATNIIDALASITPLHPGLSVAEAIDVLWTLNSPEIHRHLVVDSGWAPDRFRTWLADTLIAALLPPPTP